MQVGIPKNPRTGSPLVAGTPDTVTKLIKLGYTVAVESGAGSESAYPDSQYEAAGAAIVGAMEAWQADIVLVPDAPETQQLDMMKSGSTLISRIEPGNNPDYVDALVARKITALAMDAIPRISRAQSMDVRSSMANISGYRAVIEAASHFGRLFTGQVTAAGKVPPATIYVIGAGVAGLAALGTANSMGAIVKATDVRSDVAEQVQSMGAEFVEIPVTQESADGYAREMTADQADAAGVVYAREAQAADIVITTALIPNRPAPILITKETVAKMKPGSVIVDLAAANGGNVEGTVPGEVVVTDNNVTIIGYKDLALRLPGQASQLFGQNLVNFLKLITPEKDGELVLDLEDTIVRGVTVTQESTIMWPPPPVQVSAAPAAKPAAPAAAEAVEEKAPSPMRFVWFGIAALIALAIVFTAPAHMAGHFTVFLLACVVGFYVITNVTHALHTPLMSVTNAISGIIVVGAVLQLATGSIAVLVMAAIAIVIASINIFGGFTVTARMLSMFKRS